MDVAFPGPNQGLVAKNAKIRCFICQRITKDNYSGWKKALDGCGVWFHKRDSAANGAGARSATCVKSMTSPTIRTRSYQARPLDIVPSRACCGIQTTSVPHVKRSRTGATTRCYTTRPTATTKACAGSGGPSTTAARLGYTSAFVAGHRGHQQPPRRTNRGGASDSHDLHPGATPT